jgi:hypothetical protein
MFQTGIEVAAVSIPKRTAAARRRRGATMREAHWSLTIAV